MDFEAQRVTDDSEQGKTTNTEHSFRIATINARGLNKEKKRISLFNWINENKIDIALIQETYCVVSKFYKKLGWENISFIHCVQTCKRCLRNV
jgi:exonuclease III